MKSFTSKINGKLNNGNRPAQTCGRPAAEKRPRADHDNDRNPNAGFSLPEIIVAMLIVGIVIVPLLTNFAVTARVNAKSLKTNDATDYAEQIMETLKSYTPEEVDAQFATGDSEKAEERAAFKIAEIENNARTSYGRTNSDFKTSDRTPDDRKKAGEHEPRYYFIKGAKAPSGRTYDVQITYDPSQYASADSADGSVHAYNLEEFPDSAAFSRSSTAIINPNDSHVTFPTTLDGKNIFDENTQSYEFENKTSYEEMAVNAFYGVYTAFIGKVREGFENLLKTKHINSDFTLKNEDFSDGMSESARKDQLREHTERYTAIMIDTDKSKSKVYLSSYMQFQMEDDDDIYMIDKTAAIQKASEKLKNLKTDSNEDIVVTDEEIRDVVQKAAEDIESTRNYDMAPCYKVFYNDDGFNELKTVYLMFKPLSRDFKEDRVAIKFLNGAGSLYMTNKLEIYLVPQIGMLENKEPVNYRPPIITSIKQNELIGGKDHKLSIHATGLDGSILDIYYAEGWINKNGNLSLISSIIHDDFVKTETADTIYDIKVTLYESSAGNWRNKLLELNTSGLQ